MFEIGQLVVAKNSGVCIIINKENKNFGIGENTYYVLKPYFYNENETLLYIPEDKLEMNLRNIKTKQEVLELIDSMPKIDKVWYSDSKIRHQKFEEMYKSRDLYKLCQLVKTLYFQNEKLKQNKKTLSMIDREFLEKISKEINQEFAIALEINPNEVTAFIRARGIY